MSESMEKLYQERLRRFVTALNNGKPDRVPVRPFAAEFTGRHAGYTCQQLSQNYPDAFEAMIQCCKDYDWDAVPASMVYVWTGITDAAGVKYYGVPGVNMSADFGFQYREPPEGESFMREDEYDRLIDDPTAFLYEVWLPRASRRIQSAGDPVTLQHNAALVSAAMAVTQYFNAFGPHCARLRGEVGMPGAIAGIFKAPLDIIGDKMRGYLGLTMDLIERPEKVKKACEALMPHLFWVANATADPCSQLPVGYWMHRGCVPFVRPETFDDLYWPTVRPIIEELWRNGHQTMFYAEGKWDRAHAKTTSHFGGECITPDIVAETRNISIFLCFRALPVVRLDTKICEFISAQTLNHGITRGIERFCKIAMPLLFIVAIILAVRVFTLGTPVREEWDISGGMGFLWNPDFSALKSAKVWLAAAGQVFFSISVGIGTLLTYASYMKSRDDVLTSSTTAAFLNEFAELVLGASIVIPAAFIFFGPAGTTEAVSGGTFGLAFKTTPLIFKDMGGGPLIGFCWFFLLFIAGCTSSVSIIQPALSFLQDEFGFDRRRCVIVLGALTFAFANLAIFGTGVIDEMDFWFSSFGLPLFGFIEALFFVFVFGADRGWAEMHRGARMKLPGFLKFVMRWCTPIFLFLILFSWLVTEGWKTILMIKTVDGQWEPLYAGDAFWWVLVTRIALLGVFAATCLQSGLSPQPKVSGFRVSGFRFRLSGFRFQVCRSPARRGHCRPLRAGPTRYARFSYIHANTPSRS
jgi:SNF family Na+-dependent transporter